MYELIKSKLSHLSSETVGWMAVVIIHAATIPNFLAVMQGITDRLPQIDMLLMIWLGLALFFVKAIISRDMLNIITIGLGFVIQAVMLSLIFIR